MKNKKGDITTTEVLKIVAAVVGITFLIILAVKIYENSKSTEIEQARINTEKMFLKINEVENGESAEEEVLIESPNDWWVIAWPYKDETEKPIQCNKDFCVCICPVSYSSILLASESASFFNPKLTSASTNSS